VSKCYASPPLWGTVGVDTLKPFLGHGIRAGLELFINDSDESVCQITFLASLYCTYCLLHNTDFCIKLDLFQKFWLWGTLAIEWCSQPLKFFVGYEERHHAKFSSFSYNGWIFR